MFISLILFLVGLSHKTIECIHKDFKYSIYDTFVALLFFAL